MPKHNEVEEIIQFINAFQLSGDSKDAGCCLTRLTAEIDEDFLMDRAKEVKGVEVFNLGTGKGYSVLDIVKNFEDATGVKVKYEIVERRPGDIAECYADPTKAYEVLGWKAEKTLKDMCEDAWRFTQNQK